MCSKCRYRQTVALSAPASANVTLAGFLTVSLCLLAKNDSPPVHGVSDLDGRSDCLRFWSAFTSCCLASSLGPYTSLRFAVWNRALAPLRPRESYSRNNSPGDGDGPSHTSSIDFLGAASGGSREALELVVDVYRAEEARSRMWPGSKTVVRVEHGSLFAETPPVPRDDPRPEAPTTTGPVTIWNTRLALPFSVKKLKPNFNSKSKIKTNSLNFNHN